MEEWREYKLGDISTMKYGKLPPKSIGGKYPVWSGYRFVGTSDVMNCPKGTMVVVARGVGGTGDVKIAKENCYLTNLSIAVNLDTTFCNPYYLYYKYLLKNLKYLDSGSAQSQITIDDLKRLQIELPSLDYQNRTVAILKSLDDKIEVNRRINENLEQQAQALFKSWFVDFEPFKNGEFVESELGMIPKGWRVGTLNEIALINPSRTLRKGETAAYLDMKNMPTSGPFPLYFESKEYTGGMRFQNQDTLMARITPCLENGKVAYVNFLNDGEIAFGSTEYIVMTTKNGFMPELLYFLCRDESFKSYATKNMNGSSGRQRVSGETIGDYKIAIPPKSLISPIAPYLKSVMDNIKNNGFESRRLAQLRDTLLPRLMSGELKVNEIENVL